MKMSIKMIAILLTMSVSAHSLADETKEIGGLTYNLIGGKATVIKSSQENEVVEIPETLEYGGETYTVEGIKDRAFFNDIRMVSLSLPSTITWIGEKAFYGCNKLESLDMPSSVLFIGENAFEKCTSIETLNISSNLPFISEGTFYECYSIKSVNIPSSVRWIGKSAFYNCESMESLTIPESVDSIASYAFYGCDDLKTVTIPSGVRKLDECVFWNCSALESVTLSSSIEEINRGTFYGCHSLVSVMIPPSVTTIGKRAFEQCMKLPFVIIPPSVTKIDEDAFKNCENLTTIVSYPTNPPFIGSNAFYRVPAEAVVFVIPETLKQYPTADGWNVFSDFRALGSVELSISSPQLNLKVGESAAIDVSVDKAFDVEILSEEWTTSNPTVAIVKKGMVTAVGEGSATISYILIDGTGCPHIISCDIFVAGMAKVEGISDDDSHLPTEYYNMNGVRINSENLAPGLYIKKDGKRSVKVLVK